MEIQQGKFCGGPWVPVHVDHNPALAPSGVLRISRAGMIEGFLGV